MKKRVLYKAPTGAESETTSGTILFDKKNKKIFVGGDEMYTHFRLQSSDSDIEITGENDWARGTVLNNERFLTFFHRLGFNENTDTNVSIEISDSNNVAASPRPSSLLYANIIFPSDSLSTQLLNSYSNTSYAVFNYQIKDYITISNLDLATQNIDINSSNAYGNPIGILGSENEDETIQALIDLGLVNIADIKSPLTFNYMTSYWVATNQNRMSIA